MGVFSYSLESSWRKIFNISLLASPYIRREAGHTIKNSVKCTFHRGTRNDPLLPTKGYHFQASQELALGILGGVSFSKTEASSQYYLPLPFNLVYFVSILSLLFFFLLLTRVWD